MTPSLPQFYSGSSTLALVARLSAFSAGLVYGNAKLKVLKMKAKSEKKAEAKKAEAKKAEAKEHH